MKVTSQFALSNVMRVGKAERGTHADGKNVKFRKKVTLTFPKYEVKLETVRPYDCEVS